VCGFCNRQRDTVKLLCREDDGRRVCAKRLERGTSASPSRPAEYYVAASAPSSSARQERAGWPAEVMPRSRVRRPSNWRTTLARADAEPSAKLVEPKGAAS